MQIAEDLAFLIGDRTVIRTDAENVRKDACMHRTLLLPARGPRA